jgi:hypothetical protein
MRMRESPRARGSASSSGSAARPSVPQRWNSASRPSSAATCVPSSVLPMCSRMGTSATSPPNRPSASKSGAAPPRPVRSASSSAGTARSSGCVRAISARMRAMAVACWWLAVPRRLANDDTSVSSSPASARCTSASIAMVCAPGRPPSASRMTSEARGSGMGASASRAAARKRTSGCSSSARRGIDGARRAQLTEGEHRGEACVLHRVTCAERQHRERADVL